jgi:NADH-quinone oxidoreductase subunit M
MQFILLQSLFLPLLLSPVAYYLGRKSGPNAAAWFSFGLLTYCTVLVITTSLSGSYEEHFKWTQLFGEFGLLLDGLASPFAIIIYLVSTVLALFSKPYMVARIITMFEERMSSEKHLVGGGTEMIEYSSLKNHVNHQMGVYYALFLVMAMGMLGTVLATNLIEFSVWLRWR